jgi:hypothetical protein
MNTFCRILCIIGFTLFPCFLLAQTNIPQSTNEYKKLAKEEKISFLAASDFAYASDIDCEHMDAQGHKNLAYAVYTKLCQMGVV